MVGVLVIQNQAFCTCRTTFEIEIQLDESVTDLDNSGTYLNLTMLKTAMATEPRLMSMQKQQLSLETCEDTLVDPLLQETTGSRFMALN